MDIDREKLKRKQKETLVFTLLAINKDEREDSTANTFYTLVSLRWTEVYVIFRGEILKQQIMFLNVFETYFGTKSRVCKTSQQILALLSVSAIQVCE